MELYFQNLAETKAYDLKSNNIDLELIHLTNPDERFDVNKFYKVRVSSRVFFKFQLSVC